MVQRLNQSHKEAFVRGVLADTPRVDYNDELRKLLAKEAMKFLPTQVAAALKDPNFEGRFSSNAYASLSQWGAWNTSCYVEAVTQEELGKAVTKCEPKLKEMALLAKAQQSEMDKLREKVKALIWGFSTADAAHKALPEFVKYLPPLLAPVSRVVPAVVAANTLAELMEKGWPKKEPK